MVSQDWRILAQAVRDEQDPEKLMALIEELNQALEQRGSSPYQFRPSQCTC